jgi:hypothetical protein
MTWGTNRRKGKRDDALLNKLENIARGGDFVKFDTDGAPCVAVRLDDLLASVEWLRDLRERIGSMREEQRTSLERSYRKKQQQQRKQEPFRRKKKRRHGG